MLIGEVDGAQVYHCDWRTLLEVVPRCDAVIVDAPYSAKTHSGHDNGVSAHQGDNARGADYRNRVARPTGGTGSRRSISYAAWTPQDVREFVGAWSPRCRGWMVSITDNVLAPAWAEAMEAQGRYVFAPLPYVAPGSRVRLSGDGPSSWTCWIVVGRPRTKEFAHWGTLPGAYVLPKGQGGSMPVVGGKQPWLLCRLCEDYSRPGDLVCDPTCGGGSGLIGALRTGRRAIGGDVDLARARIAAEWIRHPLGPAPGDEEGAAEGQLALL